MARLLKAPLPPQYFWAAIFLKNICMFEELLRRIKTWKANGICAADERFSFAGLGPPLSLNGDVHWLSRVPGGYPTHYFPPYCGPPNLHQPRFPHLLGSLSSDSPISPTSRLSNGYYQLNFSIKFSFLCRSLKWFLFL